MATWTGQSFSLNQLLTSTQMNQLQADITAQSEGAVGAPKQKNASFEHYNDYKLDHFGGGALGAVTVSVNTTLDPGSREYTDFTVNSGVTLTKGSSYPGPLIIKCTGTLTISGKIEAKNAYVKTDTGGSGGGGGGGNSGPSAIPTGTDHTDVADGADAVAVATNGNNGNDANVNAIEAQLTTRNSIFYGGGAGSNGGTGTSGVAGAGGIGGGVIILIAKTIVFNSTGELDVSGNVGGNGTSLSGGGGGGGGGLILMFYETLSTDLGTYTRSGGNGGTGHRTGGDGGDGYTFKKDIAQ